ncbi:hypothetical protein AC249_AIPGENE16809, partial [Exaiptasia diaphana]
SADRSRSSRQVDVKAPAKANASSISLTTGLIQTIALIKVVYKFLPN